MLGVRLSVPSGAEVVTVLAVGIVITVAAPTLGSVNAGAATGNKEFAGAKGGTNGLIQGT